MMMIMKKNKNNLYICLVRCHIFFCLFVCFQNPQQQQQQHWVGHENNLVQYREKERERNGNEILIFFVYVF